MKACGGSHAGPKVRAGPQKPLSASCTPAPSPRSGIYEIRIGKTGLAPLRFAEGTDPTTSRVFAEESAAESRRRLRAIPFRRGGGRSSAKRAEDLRPLREAVDRIGGESRFGNLIGHESDIALTSNGVEHGGLPARSASTARDGVGAGAASETAGGPAPTAPRSRRPSHERSAGPSRQNQGVKGSPVSSCQQAR